MEQTESPKSTVIYFPHLVEIDRQNWSLGELDLFLKQNINNTTC